MSNTVKVVIEIPKEEYEYIKALSDVAIAPNTYSFLVKNGIPLDDMLEEIAIKILEKAKEPSIQKNPDTVNGLLGAYNIVYDLYEKESED